MTITKKNHVATTLISWLLTVIMFCGFATILLLFGDVPGACDSPSSPERAEYVLKIVTSFFMFAWMCVAAVVTSK